MGKNRLCRLLGLVLALVLMVTTVAVPAYAAEEEYVGSEEQLVAAEPEVASEAEFAETVEDDYINEGEVVDEEAAVVLPEESTDSFPDEYTEEGVFPADTESRLSADSMDETSSDLVAAATDESQVAEEELVGATISEGIYYIQSALGTTLGLEVAGGSTSNSANIRLSKLGENYSQAFYVKSDGNGGYFLENYHSGLRVVVAGGSTENGANVQQYRASTSASQHWYAAKGSRDGYYLLRNASATGKAMEVAGAVASAGTNVQINKVSATAAAQQWKFVPATGRTLAESRLVDAKLKTGYYTFAMTDAPNNVIEVAGESTAEKANIRLGAANGGRGQVFHVTSLGSGLYSIINPHSGKALTSASATIATGTNIHQSAYTGATTQKWYIKKDPTNGKYTISNCKASHKVVSTQSSSINAGANIQNMNFVAGRAQYWQVKNSSEAEAYRLDDGMYAIESALSSSRDMQIEKAAVTNDANVEIAAAGAKNAQRFIVTCVDKNSFTYTITNQNSRKNLAVSGSRIIQTSPSTASSQKWIIKHSGGHYTIKNVGAGKNIGVIGANTASGTNLEAAAPGSSDAQKWTFKAAQATAPTARMYTIRTAGNTSYTLHIRSGSMDNNGDVVIYGVNSGANAQKFTLIANSDGTYFAANVKSGKVLDAYGAKTASGTNVVQYGKSSRATQKWKFVPTGDADGSYYITSSGGTVLSVASGKYLNFSNVSLETKSGAEKQKFILTPTNPANGWRTTTSGKRSYYVGGAASKSKWVLISGKHYYFDASGYLVISTIVDGYYVDASGARGARATASNTNFSATINGKKTLTSYLHNAFVPAGRTLYIWGGGHGGDTAESNDAMKIGYQKTWQTFYNNNATSNYDYTKHRFKYFCGLDCSGFAGWTLYNTLYTKDDQDYVVFQSTTVAPTYIKKGWATKTTTFHPGDVVSMNGHVWISLGKCSDNTILLVHSSPKGVQISGTGGKASDLAKKYMKILAPKWPYDIRTVGSGYTSNVTIAHWVVNGTGVLKDPDGLQKMSAEQVMKFLFGE